MSQVKNTQIYLSKIIFQIYNINLTFESFDIKHPVVCEEIIWCEKNAPVFMVLSSVGFLLEEIETIYFSKSRILKKEQQYKFFLFVNADLYWHTQCKLN
jgi:hypothetical protein